MVDIDNFKNSKAGLCDPNKPREFTNSEEGVCEFSNKQEKLKNSINNICKLNRQVRSKVDALHRLFKLKDTQNIEVCLNADLCIQTTLDQPIDPDVFDMAHELGYRITYVEYSEKINVFLTNGM